MIPHNTSNCLVCGNEFPYRKSKQFCSNACKQQGYLSNKAGISLPVIVSKEKPTYDFSLSEYKAYENETGNGMELMFYFFLRRNLKGHIDQTQIKAYFEGFFCSGYSWWDYYETIKDTKAYLSFREDFLSSKFTIGA